MSDWMTVYSSASFNRCDAKREEYFSKGYKPVGHSADKEVKVVKVIDRSTGSFKQFDVRIRHALAQAAS